MRVVRTLFSAAATACVALSACGQQRSAQLILLVESDLPSEQVATVTITVRDANGAVRGELECGSHFPFSIALSRERAPTAHVHVSALNAQREEVAQVTAEAAFVAEHVRLLRVQLSRDCQGLDCNNPELTCLPGGQCGSIRRESLPSAEDMDFEPTHECHWLVREHGEGGTNGGEGGSYAGEAGSGNESGAGSGGAGNGGASGDSSMAGTDSGGAPPVSGCTPTTVAKDCPTLQAPACVEGQCSAFPTFSVGVTSHLNNVATEPRIYSVSLGDATPDAIPYTTAGFHLGSLGVSVMPSGALSFSQVAHKRPNVLYSMLRSGTKSISFERDGEYAIDAVGYLSSGTLNYAGIWQRETSPTPGSLVDGLNSTQLQAKLAELGPSSLPLRIHGYWTGTSTAFSAVFADNKQSRPFKVVLDQTADAYRAAVSQNQAEHYHPADVSAYRSDGNVLFSGIFVKDSRVTASRAEIGLTREQFEAQRVARAKEYVLQDAEYYSQNLSSDEPRAAGVWQQFANDEIQVNYPPSSLGVEGQRELDSLKTRVWTGRGVGRFGFVIQDLITGNYVGYHIQDAFYMASVSKLLVAASALYASERKTLVQLLGCADSEILTRLQQPNQAGGYSVRELLTLMLSQNSPTAEDVLIRSLAGDLNAYASWRMVSVGQIISNCETDRRLFARQNSCLRTLTCGELERWLRDGEAPTPSHAVCLPTAKKPSEEDLATYYASFANSISPLEFARFWRGILQANFMSTASRDLLLGLLPEQLAKDPYRFGTTHFAHQAGLRGTGSKLESYVGIGYDFDAQRKTKIGQFSISWFVEAMPDDTDASRTKAQKLVRDMSEIALNLLKNLR